MPAPVSDGARYVWTWSSPVFIQIDGGPAASGTRLEIHADGGPYAKRYAMVGLQAWAIPAIELTGEQIQGPSGALNDDCESPAVMTEGTVPYTGDSWFLYIAGCTGPATAVTDTGDPVIVYTGHCDNLQAIGTSSFTAECEAAYLIHVVGASTGGMLTVTCAGTCPTPCVADINGDTQVGILDFLGLLAAWGPNPGHAADLDGDGVVGILDFLILLSEWGPCPSIID